MYPACISISGLVSVAAPSLHDTTSTAEAGAVRTLALAPVLKLAPTDRAAGDAAPAGLGAGAGASDSALANLAARQKSRHPFARPCLGTIAGLLGSVRGNGQIRGRHHRARLHKDEAGVSMQR